MFSYVDEQARIQDGYVSQLHLRIQFTNLDSSPLENGEKLIVHDLSRNGTYVNNTKLGFDTSSPLKAGDILSLISGHMDTSPDRPKFVYRGNGVVLSRRVSVRVIIAFAQLNSWQKVSL